jgi:hypothetical protein
MDAPPQEIRKLSGKEILNEIIKRPEGDVTVAFKSGHAIVRWKGSVAGAESELPTVLRLGDATIELHGEGIELAVENAFEMSYHATYDTEPEERLIRSIRNSLKGKRSQMSVDAPYLLATNVDRVSSEAVSQTIIQRIFPNSEYAWISGILLYTPIRSWSPSPRPALLLHHVNPNARFPLPGRMRQVLSGDGVIRMAAPRMPADLVDQIRPSLPSDNQV